MHCVSTQTTRENGRLGASKKVFLKKKKKRHGFGEKKEAWKEGSENPSWRKDLRGQGECVETTARGCSGTLVCNA